MIHDIITLDEKDYYLVPVNERNDILFEFTDTWSTKPQCVRTRGWWGGVKRPEVISDVWIYFKREEFKDSNNIWFNTQSGNKANTKESSILEQIYQETIKRDAFKNAIKFNK